MPDPPPDFDYYEDDPEFNPDNPEWLTQYYEDEYPDPAAPQHQPGDDDEMYQLLEPYSFSEIVENCIEPTLTDASLHIGKLVVWCLIFRITAHSGRCSPWLQHLLSTTTGIVALSHFFYSNAIFFVVLTAISFVALSVAHNKGKGSKRGAIVAVTCVAFNIIGESLVASPQSWHQIRGAQMILCMKVISLAFDMDDAVRKAKVKKEPPKEDKEEEKKTKSHKKQRQAFDKPKEEQDTFTIDLSQVPNVLQFFGYALSPGNSVFGPWITFESYMRSYHNPRWNPVWITKIVLSMIYGFMFLTISTCWNPWLIPDGIWIWWSAYRDAMSFRASHYFVSYISEASLVASGLGDEDRDGNWNVNIVKPHEVEMPRSLTEVVKAWNIPMHLWLKNYCFKPSIRAFGPSFAYLLTYIGSIMLHGLNFQLAAVLFSLGFYTYVEHRVRDKLANIFNASITASRRMEEVFRHKEGSFLVIIVNFVFGLLVCFNLTYLGVMFNQDNAMEEGYSWKHTISKWESLDFSSHWLMAGLFVLQLLI